MKFPGYVTFSSGLLLVLAFEKSYAQTYKAAVVAYRPMFLTSDIPDYIIRRNEKQYIKKMEEVKGKVDIIIFPENGLTTIEPNDKPKAHLDSYSIIVPDPDSNFLCRNSDNTILDRISCAAKSNGIYVVCNVLEKTGTDDNMKFYSTDVVFDSDGRLILKCRKKYPNKETNYDKGDIEQPCTFDAKFSNNNIVKFAVLFDSDMLFYIPQEATYDLILTGSTKNVLPISYALSLQLGYAVRNKVNLLSSGYTAIGYGGSGVYLRNGTSRVSINSDPILIDEIPKDENKIVVTNVDVKRPSELNPDFDISYENIPTLNDTNAALRYNFSGENNYCKFQTDLSGNNITPYKWIALYSKREYMGQDNTHLIVCALIKLEDKKNEQKIINEITITTSIKADNVIQLLPISLSSNMLPANFKFEEEDNDTIKATTMTLTEQADLLSFGVVVILRNDPSGSSSIHMFHIYTIGFLQVILLLKTKYFV